MDDDRIAKLSDLHSVRDELSERIDRVETALTQRISEEGATTRRYVDITVERIEAAVKIVAEVSAHHAVVLDDHEARLTQVEKAR